MLDPYSLHHAPSISAACKSIKKEKMELDVGGGGGTGKKEKKGKKSRRTAEDFLRFVDQVLQYARSHGDLPPSKEPLQGEEAPFAPKVKKGHEGVGVNVRGGGAEGVNVRGGGGDSDDELLCRQLQQGNISRKRRHSSNPAPKKNVLSIGAGDSRESPLNSVGESAPDSTRSSTSSIQSLASPDPDDPHDPQDPLEQPEYDESWGMVTCWCGKPFAGRPMIECEECLIWLHLSCANIRRTHIPKNFKCAQCRPPKKRRRHSSSAPKKDKHDKHAPSTQSHVNVNLNLLSSAPPKGSPSTTTTIRNAPASAYNS